MAIKIRTEGLSMVDRPDVHFRRPEGLVPLPMPSHEGSIDLTDRTVFLHLPPIPPTTRCDEEEFWSSFHADSPRILGGVLDAVVGGLRTLPSVRLPELPRMADYAKRVKRSAAD